MHRPDTGTDQQRPLKRKRRPQPDYYDARITTGSCLCGCFAPVHGRQLYASANCRKAMQRARDKWESTDR